MAKTKKAGAKKPKRPADRPPLGVQPAPEIPGGRSESDVLLMKPFEVVLGGNPYTIELLTIRAAAAWRRKVVPIISSVLLLEDISSSTDGFGDGLVAYLADKPDTLMDLFFEYAVDLDRDEIETTATEWEVGEAFRQIVSAVMPPPLLTALNGAVEKAIP